MAARRRTRPPVAVSVGASPTSTFSCITYVRFGCDQICDHFAVKTGLRGRFVARTSEQSSRREALLVVMLTRISEESGRGDWIRTSDPLRPRQVRYQAALRPDS